MVDEAEDYELGETYSGTIKDAGVVYYRFYVPQKSHLSVWVTSAGTNHAGIDVVIYNIEGKSVIKSNDFSFDHNNVSGVFSAKNYRVVDAGSYYIELNSHMGANINYSFMITAERQISLPKGV